jgi:hypothetical protein
MKIAGAVARCERPCRNNGANGRYGERQVKFIRFADPIRRSDGYNIINE